ncbi:hypothetical protein D9M68_802510 [compost metagenome]
MALPANSASRWATAEAIAALRSSTDRACRRPFRLAAPMSYMLTVAMARIRGSILAALMTKLPLPQMPMAPTRSLSTNGWLRRKSTAALKSSV